ncbi:hypothetical protein ASPZODRAFT_140112 [Penicilliopsis zonata CBS 506.65]|uniref:Uncharacterized protein n=1 Tax=Penicilliopsis zonata CBS 506.65 TaxID=1073090 RepID=A0A1L9SPJ2_9EURO|nr:hypothetical protein ASPZODRAFT_140112 [Penicilliopsis zonata CBS 506.65]OJJ49179.1 hypothetical protein ASPZODRAFT_140112 [Penicilliopsis zonata CBS 506.65]
METLERQDQLSRSSSTDSASEINSATSKATTTTTTTTTGITFGLNPETVSDRLAVIMQQVAAHSGFSQEDSVTIHRCLDAIESVLDPRAQLTNEVIKYRPQRPRSWTTITTTTTTTPPPITKSVGLLAPDIHCSPSVMEPKTDHQQLTVLLKDVTMLHTGLQQRRKEANQIYKTFRRKCRGLEERIVELEEEVDELQTGMQENSVELEGLRGTVRGLESWVEGWQMQHGWTEAKRTSRPSAKRGRWGKRKTEDARDAESDVLVEGINAWMRGWKDVEEGSRLREQGRRLRRDERLRHADR